MTLIRTRSISLYWQCQLIGWSVAALYWSYNAWTGNRFDVTQGVADFVLDVLAGILITHLYRMLVMRWRWYALDLKALLPRIIPAILILAIVYGTIVIAKLYAVRLFFVPQWLPSFQEYFVANAFTLFITGTRLMAIWVLAYHLYHYAQREIGMARKNAQLSVIAKEAQLGRLAAQLNPHFFFNSLNTIKFLTATNPTTARRSIDLLSGLLRHTLYTKQDKLMPLSEEIALVNDYLELEQLRFEERLQYTITVPAEAAGLSIPPFCIQTLVENAIKHGIDKRKAGGSITVAVLLQLQSLQIQVSNTGTLIPDARASGLGLQNLRERLALQFGDRAQCTIVQAEPHRVEATLVIPRS